MQMNLEVREASKALRASQAPKVSKDLRVGPDRPDPRVSRGCKVSLDQKGQRDHRVPRAAEMEIASTPYAWSLLGFQIAT